MFYEIKKGDNSSLMYFDHGTVGLYRPTDKIV